MSTDLPDRLRTWADLLLMQPPSCGICLLEAASEIERLREALDRIAASGAYPEAAIAEDALAT